MFRGTYTALVTPFKDDAIDFEALGALIETQVEAGVEGVVPCGSTGESATLSHEEHERLIAFSVEKAAGRVRVIAGTGSNSTKESIRLTKFAKDSGADAALLIAPYYNKPTQDGLLAHFRSVGEAVDLPQLLYNIPGRCAVNIDVATVAKLAEIPNIVGIKEASGSLDQVSRTIEACGPNFSVLSGDDSLTLPMMSVGGHGVIGVIPNLLPKKMRELVDAALSGDFETARAVHFELLPLMRAMGLETNPIPVKAALSLLGNFPTEMRLPLTRLREENVDVLRGLLSAAGLSPVA